MHYVVFNHLFEDADGVVRQRAFGSFAANEEACVTCCKVAFLTWLKSAVIPEGFGNDAPIIPMFN